MWYAGNLMHWGKCLRARRFKHECSNCTANHLSTNCPRGPCLKRGGQGKAKGQEAPPPPVSGALVQVCLGALINWLTIYPGRWLPYTWLIASAWDFASLMGCVDGCARMCKKQTYSNNLKLVQGMGHTVQEKMSTGIALGGILGLYCRTPLPKFRISPLGRVPKSTRIIYHDSPPILSSRILSKDAIDLTICTVKYTTFDVAVDLIRSLDPAMSMAKCDIKPAFRLLPVHPEDFNLLGFMFGSSSATIRLCP